jgi:hypothetical protein
MAMMSTMLALCAPLAAQAALPAYRMELVKGDGTIFPKFIDAINNRSEIAGSVKGAEPHPHHYTLARISGTAITPLPNSHWMQVEGLNDQGDVLAVDGLGKPAIWWHDGMHEVINHLDWAYAINNRGQVAGMNHAWWAAVHDHGVVKVLEALDEYGLTHAYDINDSGMVAGDASYLSGGHYVTEAAIWDADGKIKLLGNFGGDWGMAVAINRLGHAVGFSDVLGAFFYNGNEMVRVPAADACVASGATAINDHDLVLLHNECGAERGPLLWQGGKTRYLRELVADGAQDWQTIYAQGINNAGQIVGWGLHKGKYRSFIATPLKRAH